MSSNNWFEGIDSQYIPSSALGERVPLLIPQIIAKYATSITADLNGQ